MTAPFSYETFLHILEHDDLFLIDETAFYFDDDPDETDHMLGCLRDFDLPYWLGYCDIPGGCSFSTADDMLNAGVFDGQSIKERWKHIILYNIGGIGTPDWLNMYQDNL